MSYLENITAAWFVTVAFCLWSIPGMLIFWANCPRERFSDVILSGLLYGIILQQFSLYYAAFLGVSVGLIFLVATMSALAVVIYRQRIFWLKELKWNRGLIFVLSLVFLTRMAIACFHEMPLGSDPAFHLILAKKIALQGRFVQDWLPFSSSPINYPLGLHHTIVWLSSMSQVPLEKCFQFLNQFVGVCLTALVYRWTWCQSRNEKVAVLAAFAFGMTAILGSIDYYRWGGLPNQMGMLVLVFVAIELLFFSSRTSKAIALLGFGAIFLLHHHVMLTSVCLIASIACYQAWNERRLLPILHSALIGLASLLLVFPEAYAYITKILMLENTNVLKFKEKFLNFLDYFESLGFAFLASVLAGIWFYSRAKLSWRETVLMSSVLGGLYFLTGFVYRFWTLVQFDEAFVAFTPSRFLTNLVVFISPFAGYGIFRLTRNLSDIKKLVVYSILALSTYEFWWLSLYRKNPLDKDVRHVLEWIGENTPNEAFICNQEEGLGYQGDWLPYISWRPSFRNLLPISELQDDAYIPYKDAMKTCKTEGRVSQNLYLLRIHTPEQGISSRDEIIYSYKGYSVVKL